VSAQAKPAVLHLVWGPLGAGPLRAFVRSYREHDAGAEHDLVIVLNGVDPAARPVLLAELEGTPHRLVELPHPVLDLAAYADACAALDHPHVCVLNSHSRVRTDGWLAALATALAQPGVGIAGASGSWASMRSYALYYLRLPSAYARTWPDRTGTLAALQAIDDERRGAPAATGARSHLYTLVALLDMMRGFPRFPAPHIRSNGFMIERTLLARMLGVRLRRKVDTHRLESGAHSITAQLRSAGRRALVVDRMGSAYDVEEWPQSETFWQGDQRDLLVADNQTDTYASGDLERRRVLAGYAWGERGAARAREG
jgi:hypothetical protein